MSRYKSRRKAKQLKKVEENLSEELTKEFSKMALRCKFNFSYLDINQDGAVGFDYFTEPQLKELVDKIKSFTIKSLRQWENDGTLIIYGEFPIKTNFKHPSFVPQAVQWGRFRLQGALRLCGFVVPALIAREHEDLDTNTFYVVFLDPEHNFFISKKRHT